MKPPETIKHRQQRVNRTYVFQSGYVALVALLFLTVSLSFWFDPNQIGRSLGHVAPYDYYWNGFYLVGSVAALFGLLSRRVGIEAAGHILLVPGLFLNFIIAASVLGVHSSTFLTFVFMVGATLRAVGLVMGWQEAQNGD